MNSGILLAMAIGPVQDFIAQARRSRDLWFGSHLLSEIARAAAHSLATDGASLIFPAIGPAPATGAGATGPLPTDPTARALRRCKGPYEPEPPHGPVLAIPNKLLALLPADVEIEAIAGRAREAARSCWRQVARDVLQRDGKALIDAGIWTTEQGNPAGAIRGVWSEQIGRLLEIYVAWDAVPETRDGAGFARTRHRLEQALAARKTLRDFRQQEHQRIGAPKSSLDGGRVSVLVAKKQRGETFRRVAGRFRIASEEHLDAVGLVKRCGGAPDQFVPVANIALAEWLEAARRDPADHELLERLGADDQARAFGTIAPYLSANRRLAVDAQCLLESRLRTLFEEHGAANLRDAVEQFAAEYPRRLNMMRSKAPHPYVAVIVADGDRMGAFIDEVAQAGADAPTRLQQVSRALGSFAEAVRQVVEGDGCKGSLLYAGGDDVVAFAPLGTAIQCAQRLREVFDEHVGRHAATLAPKARRPTRSVGVGIGHVLVGMGELIELGREAERLAKGTLLVDKTKRRDALAIVLAKRSGGEARWRRQWSARPAQLLSDAIERLARPQNRVQPGAGVPYVPTTKLQQIRRDLTRMPGCAAKVNGVWAQILGQDVLRTLNRRDGGGASGFSLGDFGLRDPLGESYGEAWATLDEWIRRHLIAKELRAGSYGLDRPSLGGSR